MNILLVLTAAAGPEEYRALYEELEIMSNVGNHPNLVNLIGATAEEAEEGSSVWLKKIIY